MSARPTDMRMKGQPASTGGMASAFRTSFCQSSAQKAAVSTSGLGWKYPGRVGDSPLIGAGNYCDNRYGAAACTGMGELAIRAGSARSLVLYLKCGLSLVDAGCEALRDLLTLAATDSQYMNIVALTPAGEHAGFTTVAGKEYLFQEAGMAEPQLAARLKLEA